MTFFVNSAISGLPCTWFSLGDDLEGNVDPVVASGGGTAGLAVFRLEGCDLDAVGTHTRAVLLPVQEGRAF